MMMAAAVVARILGVDAEGRSLEEITSEESSSLAGREANDAIR
jgi:hypothetical protein